MKMSFILNLILSMLASSCVLRNYSAEVIHNPNEYTRQNNPNALDWATSKNPLDDYERLIAPILRKNGKPAAFLPKSDPLTMRLQYWLNVLDAQVRTQLGNLPNIPPPVANLATPAAFIDDLPVGFVE